MSAAVPVTTVAVEFVESMVQLMAWVCPSMI
jgi:hypothetical protein